MSDIVPRTGPEGPGDVNWRIPFPGGSAPGLSPNTGNGRNNNRRQLLTPEVRTQIGRVLDQNQKANYFRHAGMGAALRHTLGLPQTPSHLNDYFRAQTRRPQTGLDPKGREAEEHGGNTVTEPMGIDEAMRSGGEQGAGKPGYWAPFSGVPGSGSASARAYEGAGLLGLHRQLWQNLTGQGQ
jgi:hypothetical protein